MFSAHRYSLSSTPAAVAAAAAANVTPAIELRNAQPEDLQDILAINEAAVPAVNSLSPHDMRRLFDQAASFRVAALPDGEVVGFMNCVAPGTAYDSINYRWFSERYESFLYIDRIALHPKAQRQGLGQRLYAEAKAAAAEAGGPLVCEVNIRPRNDMSLAFHDRLGFRSVGQQETEGGKKTVTMLVYEPQYPL